MSLWCLFRFTTTLKKATLRINNICWVCICGHLHILVVKVKIGVHDECPSPQHRILTWFRVTTFLMAPAHSIHCCINWGHWTGLLDKRHNIKSKHHRVCRQIRGTVLLSPCLPGLVCRKIGCCCWSGSVLHQHSYIHTYIHTFIW